MKVGILGGGQLAQMLAQAGTKLGVEFKFLCPERNACAAPYGEIICSDYEDQAAHQALIDWADVITYEFENIPFAQMEKLEQRAKLYPPAYALKVASDRLPEKRMFNALGIPTADFEPVDTLDQLQQAVQKLGQPGILKTRTQGYDGKGQVRVDAQTDLSQAWDSLNHVSCIYESMVSFQREVSIIAGRDSQGDIQYFPLTENHHREGILRLSLCLKPDPLQAQAESLIKKVMTELNYVGIVALELFQTHDQLIANEIAPRVHNSGHWTLDGTKVSQFENHLRAVCGIGMVQPQLKSPSAMVNLIGELPSQESLKGASNVHWYDYGKSPRPGRKLGHINLTGDGVSEAAFFQQLKALLLLTGETALAGQDWEAFV